MNLSEKIPKLIDKYSKYAFHFFVGLLGLVFLIGLLLGSIIF